MRRICPGPLGPGGRTKQGLSAPHRLHLDSDRPPHGGWGALVIRASRSLPGRPSAAPVGAGPALDAWQQRTARGGVWDPVDTKKGTARSAGAGGGGSVRCVSRDSVTKARSPPHLQSGQGSGGRPGSRDVGPGGSRGGRPRPPAAPPRRRYRFGERSPDTLVDILGFGTSWSAELSGGRLGTGYSGA